MNDTPHDKRPAPGMSSGNEVDVAHLRIALIGYGEVGGIFGAALAARGVRSITLYDVLLGHAASGEHMRNRARRDRLAVADSPTAAVADADLVISAVTASATHAAVMSTLPSLKRGAFLLDVNSASPKVKAACGPAVAAAGARYVEAAVMTSVPPYGIRVPMLLGGPDAPDAAPILTALGFAATVASPTLGVASAIKMCRSIIIKGMEALAIESFMTARRYGVEDAVLASLAETFPGLDWEKNGSYFFRRVVQHGKRRAEEMREAATTVREAGLAPFMAAATANRQAWMAELARAGTFDGLDPDDGWRVVADRTNQGSLK